MEKKMLRKMAIQKGRVEEVLNLLSAIYGNPAATRLWVKKNHVYMTDNCKLKNSNIDGQVYYLNDVKTIEGSRTRASMNNVLVVGLHVDDIRKKKREGFVVPYGTDLLLEPYGFATIQIFYNVNHKS